MYLAFKFGKFEHEIFCGFRLLAVNVVQVGCFFSWAKLGISILWTSPTTNPSL